MLNKKILNKKYIFLQNLFYQSIPICLPEKNKDKNLNPLNKKRKIFGTSILNPQDSKPGKFRSPWREQIIYRKNLNLLKLINKSKNLNLKKHLDGKVFDYKTTLWSEPFKQSSHSSLSPWSYFASNKKLTTSFSKHNKKLKVWEKPLLKIQNLYYGQNRYVPLVENNTNQLLNWENLANSEIKLQNNKDELKVSLGLRAYLPLYFSNKKTITKTMPVLLSQSIFQFRDIGKAYGQFNKTLPYKKSFFCYWLLPFMGLVSCFTALPKNQPFLKSLPVWQSHTSTSSNAKYPISIFSMGIVPQGSITYRTTFDVCENVDYPALSTLNLWSNSKSSELLYVLFCNVTPIKIAESHKKLPQLLGGKHIIKKLYDFYYEDLEKSLTKPILNHSKDVVSKSSAARLRELFIEQNALNSKKKKTKYRFINAHYW